MTRALEVFVLLNLCSRGKLSGWINLKLLVSLSGERGRGKEERGWGMVVVTF